MAEKVQLQLRFELDGEVTVSCYEAESLRRGSMCAFTYREEDGTEGKLMLSRTSVTVQRISPELTAHYRFEAERPEAEIRLEAAGGTLALAAETLLCQVNPILGLAEVRYTVQQGNGQPVKGHFTARVI